MIPSGSRTVAAISLLVDWRLPCLLLLLLHLTHMLLLLMWMLRKLCLTGRRRRCRYHHRRSSDAPNTSSSCWATAANGLNRAECAGGMLLMLLLVVVVVRIRCRRRICRYFCDLTADRWQSVWQWRRIFCVLLLLLGWGDALTTRMYGRNGWFKRDGELYKKRFVLDKRRWTNNTYKTSYNIIYPKQEIVGQGTYRCASRSYSATHLLPGSEWNRCDCYCPPRRRRCCASSTDVYLERCRSCCSHRPNLLSSGKNNQSSYKRRNKITGLRIQ